MSEGPEGAAASGGDGGRDAAPARARVADWIARRFGAQARELERVAALSERFETDADGCRIVWRSWGSGRPVVLLHGGSGSWNHWIRNVEALADSGMRVIVPDMPGYGDSDDVALPHNAAHIAELVDRGFARLEAAPQSFTLVGFSFGCVVSGHWAAAGRASIDRFVLVGAGGLGASRERQFELRGWKRLADPEQVLDVHRHNLAVLMLRETDPIDPLALYLQAINTDRSRFVSRFASRGDSLAGMLSRIDAPISGIWGAHDVTAVDGVDHQERVLRERALSLRFDVVDGAGHWVQFERADAFNRALIATLRDD